jgi:hypothetical protein
MVLITEFAAVQKAVSSQTPTSAEELLIKAKIAIEILMSEVKYKENILNWIIKS